MSSIRIDGNFIQPTYNQDRIVLMSVQSYNGNISGVADIPYEFGSYDPDEDAAVVRYQTNWYPELTFAHEVGHTFGGWHDEIDPPNITPCANGFIFGGGGFIGGQDRTLMATLFPGVNAVPSSSAALILSDPNNTFPFNGQNVPVSDGFVSNKTVIHNTLCEITSLQEEQDEVVWRFLNNPNADYHTVAYPNPVKDHINIENRKLKKAYIISIDGKDLDLNITNSTNSIDVSNLDEGIFLLKLIYEDREETIKFIKQ